MNFRNQEYDVIIPVKNGAKYIREAIDSVLSQIQRPNKIILVDDHSTDETIDIVGKHFNVKIIRNQGEGQAAAINTGIQECKSEFVSFIDHDDLWTKNRISNWLLLNARDFYYVCGGVINFNEDSGQEKDMGPARVLGACMFKRTFLMENGKFQENIKHHSIFEWWSRVDDFENKGNFTEEPYLKRRIHQGNSGVVHKREADNDLMNQIRMHLRSRHD